MPDISPAKNGLAGSSGFVVMVMRQPRACAAVEISRCRPAKSTPALSQPVAIGGEPVKRQDRQAVADFVGAHQLHRRAVGEHHHLDVLVLMREAMNAASAFGI